MILITTHTNADFDSLASMVAGRYLYPEARLCLPGSAETVLRQFIEAQRDNLPEMLGLKHLNPEAVTHLVCMDVSNRGRLGPLASLLDRTPPPVLDVYDHHPNLCEFQGRVHRVEETGACTSILVETLKEKGITPTPSDATLFLLGIYEDTGFLTFPTTRIADYRAAITCHEWGGDLDQVARTLHRGLTESQMRLLSELMESLEAVPVGGVTVYITSLASSEYIPDLSILVHEILTMEELDVLFLLAYLENRVHIIARSRTPAVDVSRVLEIFGGGGHPSAAAATIRGKTLEEARRLLLQEITTGHPVGHRASELFTTSFRSVEAGATLREASREMNRYRINALPVFEGGTLVGMVTRQEVDGALQHGMADSAVNDLMVAMPPILPPDTPAEEVRRIMLERNSRLVLFGDGPDRIVGLLSRMTLFKGLYQLDQRLLHHRPGGHPPRREIQDLLTSSFSQEEAETLKELGSFARSLKMNCLLVGGAVRDILLKSRLMDVDFVVEGDAAELALKFAAVSGGSVKSHKMFGTAVWKRPGGDRWDFATARAEYYEEPAALPTVAHAALYQDLYRRDFTINTLAIHLEPERYGEILDLFGGVRDLKAGRIRVLHGLSFVEDPTRAFRAVRFSVRLGFNITPETLHLMTAARKQGVFRHLSAKRLLHELELILVGPSAVEGLMELESHGLLKVVWPSLKITPKLRERLYRLQRALDFFEVNFPGEGLERLCLFLMVLMERQPTKEVEALQKHYPLSHNAKDLLSRYRSLTWHGLRDVTSGEATDGRIYEVLRDKPLEWVVFLLARLDGAREQGLVRDYLTRHRFTTLEITGNDLLKAGYSPSWAFGRALLAARKAKIDGRAPKRKDQLAVALGVMKELAEPPDGGGGKGTSNK